MADGTTENPSITAEDPSIIAQARQLGSAHGIDVDKAVTEGAGSYGDFVNEYKTQRAPGDIEDYAGGSLEHLTSPEQQLNAKKLGEEAGGAALAAQFLPKKLNPIESFSDSLASKLKPTIAETPNTVQASELFNVPKNFQTDPAYKRGFPSPLDSVAKPIATPEPVVPRDTYYSEHGLSEPAVKNVIVNEDISAGNAAARKAGTMGVEELPITSHSIQGNSRILTPNATPEELAQARILAQSKAAQAAEETAKAEQSAREAAIAEAQRKAAATQQQIADAAAARNEAARTYRINQGAANALSSEREAQVARAGMSNLDKAKAMYQAIGESPVGSAVGKTLSVVNKIPFANKILPAASIGDMVYQGAQAKNYYDQNRPLQAFISGVGALGAGASAIPSLPSKIIGGGLATAAPILNSQIDKAYVNPEQYMKDALNMAYGQSNFNPAVKKKFAEGGEVGTNPSEGGINYRDYPNPYQNPNINGGGLRAYLKSDGTYGGEMIPKSTGLLDELHGTGPNAGKSMTEYSIGDETGDYPSLVPTLNSEDIKNVLNGNITPEVAKKARAWSDSRKAQGMSPFYNPPGFAEGGEVDSTLPPVSVTAPKPSPEEMRQYKASVDDLFGKKYSTPIKPEIVDYTKIPNAPEHSLLEKGLSKIPYFNEISQGINDLRSPEFKEHAEFYNGDMPYLMKEHADILGNLRASGTPLDAASEFTGAADYGQRNPNYNQDLINAKVYQYTNHLGKNRDDNITQDAAGLALGTCNPLLTKQQLVDQGIKYANQNDFGANPAYKE